MILTALQSLIERYEQNPHTGAVVKAPDPHWGMHPALYALVFGVISGTSLPIGSWLGVFFSPVKDKTCALMMAFGAGALLFAVTVELYGHALHEVAAGRTGLGEMFTTICGALMGAAFYLTINQWLEDYLMNDHTHDVEGDAEEAQEKTPGGRRSSSGGLREALRAEEEEARKKEAEADEALKKRGKELWSKVRMVKNANILRSVSLMTKDDLTRVRGREKAIRALQAPEEIQHAKSVAFALFLGLLVDGVPEGILMGFLAAEGHLTPVLIISLFVANFPEAFSSASLLIQAKMSIAKIIGMWSGLCLLVGSLSGMSCYLLLLWFPHFGEGGHGGHLPLSVLLGIALVEGITGGAMIACISSVMLPEAFERAGKEGPFYSQSGFLCVCGFLLSVALKATFG